MPDPIKKKPLVASVPAGKTRRSTAVASNAARVSTPSDAFTTDRRRLLDSPPAPSSPAETNPALVAEVAARRAGAGFFAANRPGTIQVGTYNLGRGNIEPNAYNDGARFHIDETARHLAREVMKPVGGLDVVMLQEFSTIRGATENPADNPHYTSLMLGAVFRESLGADWEGATLSWQSVDDHGQELNFSPNAHATTRVTATLPDGTTRTVDLKTERLDSTGEAFTGSGPAPATVTTMTLPPGRTYTLAFGASDASSDSNYGNAILLGPGRQIPRRDDGSIDPRAFEVITLGADEDGEVRTALSINARTPSGEDARFVATHFTAGGGQPDTLARQMQYRALFEHTRSLGDQEVVVGGDFNSTPTRPAANFFESSVLERFSPPTYPHTAEGGLRSTDTGLGGIDHVLHSDNVSTTGPTNVVEGGGSDHLLVETEVKLG